MDEQREEKRDWTGAAVEGGEEGNVFLERCVAVHLCEYVSAIGCSDSSLVVAYLLGEQGEVPKYPIR